MVRVNVGFNKFLNKALKILFVFVLIGGSVETTKILDDKTFKWQAMILFFGTVLLACSLSYVLKHGVSKKVIIGGLFLIALVIRVIWFYGIDSIPISDFNRMYICAGDFLKGEDYMFKGTGYMARFPHMSINVLYFAFIRKIFSNPLIAIRAINIIFSMINVLILYFIGKEIFNDEKKSIWVLFISVIYPPMILYNNVYCSENIAMPLFLLSILLFLKAISRKNKLVLLIFSSLALSFTNLFRPIGYVVIIAYIMYLLIYFKDSIKAKLGFIIAIISGFLIPSILVSYSLIALNITENPLWHGTEPPSISILKGTNLTTYGRWNEEDAKVFGQCGEDYEKADEEAKRIIKNRLTKTPAKELVRLYVVKYANQWRSGEFGGICWAEAGLNEAYNKAEYLQSMGKSEGRRLINLSGDGAIVIQIGYMLLLILCYKGLYKKHDNYKIDLLYILFCGFSIQCLITESQDRYTYITSWIFILLAITAFYDNKKVEVLKVRKLGEGMQRVR